ncbi:MAG: succinylglutamate desuccinylase/aspartoacylase family protein [Patescibacteria group bacterium]|jgi:succinylglutamate desuccinylase
MSNAPDGVITLTGSQPGKTVTIMGGVHGDEVCGVQIIDKLRRNLKVDRGTVHLIYGNPRAIQAGKRFVEVNLNRVFREPSELNEKQGVSYEAKRARELMPYLVASDALLDIHSSNTPDSPPFVICEANSYELAKHFPFATISSGWDVLEPGGTDAYVNTGGGQGITVECGYHLDPKAPEIAEETAWEFLKLMGAIDGEQPLPKVPIQTHIQVWHIHITKHNFRPARVFQDFEWLQPNELIGHDGDEQVMAPAASCILFCRKREDPGEEAFLLGRKMD